MLRPHEYKDLTPEHWEKIAGNLIHSELKKLNLEGADIIFAVSDAHEGGVTSCMPQVKNVLLGFERHASKVILNGDDYEYESPAALTNAIKELNDKHIVLAPDQLQELGVKILHEEVDRNIAALESLIRENPHRQIIKIMGNHENFETFRKGLDRLQAHYPNFQWCPEMAIIPIPGTRKHKKGDVLLAVHGDLQMDDLWFVGEGGTDRERKNHTHEEMAARAVGIATNYWMPSAQKQEKWQWVVDWWRESKATAKTLYAELLFRASLGSGFQQQDINMKDAGYDLNADKFTIRKLNRRKEKFERLLEESKKDLKRGKISPADAEQKEKVYDRALYNIKRRLEIISGKAEKTGLYNFQHLRTKADLTDKVLYYKTPGDNTLELFTKDALKDVTHVNFGHTHVLNDGLEINGMAGKVTVSNNASVTGANMRVALNKEGDPKKKTSTKEEDPDLRNLGAKLYICKDGKIERIIRIGELIAKNMYRVSEMVKDVPLPKTGKGGPS